MRKVNSVTKPIFFSLPLLEDVFQTVAENNPSVFSVCDFTSGFYQIFMDESSKPKTSFITHRGSYQFKRMPFGLQGAPPTFCQHIAKTLRTILFSYALCYVDDVLVLSDSPERHTEHLTEIFDRFRQANLRQPPQSASLPSLKLPTLVISCPNTELHVTCRKSKSLKHSLNPKMHRNFVAT